MPHEFLFDQNTFYAVLEASPYGVILSNMKGKIVLCNEKAANLFGYSKEELLELGIEDLVPTRQRQRHAQYRRHYAQHPSPRKMGIGLPLFGLRKDGEKFRADISLSSIQEKNETLYLATIKDITEEHKVMRKIERLARYDALTKLPNRAYFTEILEQEVTFAQRHHTKFALLLMDINHFKSINDMHGHIVGDQLLAEIADRFSHVIRKEDFFARLNGDEFAIILREIEDDAIPGVIAQKLIEIIHAPFILSSLEIRVTLSVGITLYPKWAQSVDDLLKTVDIALFRAKRSGPDKTEYFTEKILLSHMRYLNLQAGLLSAMEKNELFLVYQPLVRLSDKKIIGMEALLRWNHPKLGLILPDIFIPIGEISGLMPQIGEWVFQQVCIQMRLWKGWGLKIPQLSVNISPLELNQDLPKKLLKHCREYQLAPKELNLEITETGIMNPHFNPGEILRELHGLGFSLSIDDFGSGYSSLSRLSQIPFTTLKIDKLFMKNIAKRKSNIVINAIFDLAKNLNLQVIAEGIETEADHEYLVNVKCTMAQGFYYYHPLKEEEIREILSKIEST